MIKKILITGANGFVSKSLIPLLKKEGYNVLAFSRQELDVTNIEQLRVLFRKEEYFDWVIHGAMSGKGRLLQQDKPEEAISNILMQENLLHLSPFYDHLCVFNSGAQENRNKDIMFLPEETFFEPPTNNYSISKYINARRAQNNNKVLALRIFNLFGDGEKTDRFIKSNIIKYINKQPIEIWGDVYFDFFYNYDAFLTLNHFIKNPPKNYQEINLVYEQKKYKLSEIASIINELDNHKVEIIIKEGINKNYTGVGNRLRELNLPLKGLEFGIKEVYNKLKEEKQWEGGGYNN